MSTQQMSTQQYTQQMSQQRVTQRVEQQVTRQYTTQQTGQKTKILAFGMLHRLCLLCIQIHLKFKKSFCSITNIVIFCFGLH